MLSTPGGQTRPFFSLVLVRVSQWSPRSSGRNCIREKLTEKTGARSRSIISSCAGGAPPPPWPLQATSSAPLLFARPQGERLAAPERDQRRADMRLRGAHVQ